jgi:hypothetical protein
MVDSFTRSLITVVIIVVIITIVRSETGKMILKMTSIKLASHSVSVLPTATTLLPLNHV